MSKQSPSTPNAFANGVLHAAREADTPGRYAHADSPEGVSDELAALFLGEDVDVHTDSGSKVTCAPAAELELKGPGGRRRPEISLLVLGNLPVFAGAWASQYARDRQKASGRPLALLTLADEAARLELYGAADSALSAAADLHRALKSAARVGADLVVRLPQAEAGWIGGECGVANMTILTGADDPAIVGAYRSLKAIVQDLPSQSAPPVMRVAVAGCDEPLAGEAGLKLAQAAERFLGLSVHREPPVRQIDAGSAVELYHGLSPAWADVPDLISYYMEQDRGSGDVHVHVEGSAQFEPRRHGPPAGFQAEGVAALHLREEGDQDPGPTISAAHPERSEGPMPSGLTPVDVACPYARAVGIAVDGQGVLHAVAWAKDSDSASGSVRDLVVASSWLRDHTELVAVILGRRLSGEPSVRHLVLGQARGSLGLAQGDLRVHVSVPSTDLVVDLN